ncbi:uncharacterized protein MELLADRAFT_106149 [Melampsora larici-populina 98AG31]|uniref:Uncharacterized protein n=1 Tax=Melampsora larici-populina (strain 98AG31 / pathotype 3-4-7) TaxID=747676 RepID=F4RKJ8_MELLP|nr:uncharacterized protein MELLADRAFT_106149 [Melampsora larici-populina 98AG31]EGG07106.1 hypothetical protein MELLADRAFT_106149 [Melampsora larici-populina 98AG31]
MGCPWSGCFLFGCGSVWTLESSASYSTSEFGKGSMGYPRAGTGIVSHDAQRFDCAIFLGLLAGCFVVWRHRPYRSLSIYILATGCFTTFLGFAVRAGISTNPDPSRVSFMVECMLFVIGQLCFLDVWVMRTRDELVDGVSEHEGVDLQAHESPRTWLLAAKHDWDTRLALASRLLIIPLCLLLYLVGYAILPGPQDVRFNSQESLKVRANEHSALGGASFLPLSILAIMDIVLVMKACLYSPAWLPTLLLFVASIMLWIPALWFGFTQAVCIMILLFLTRRPALWAYREPPEGTTPDQPPLPKYAYVPARWTRGGTERMVETAEAG